jgi:magnesium chelatase family protein
MVTISRAQGSLTFPANFQLIGAMNPCPCGYYGDAVKACTCSSSTITRYQKRLSGPLLDRIDIHVEVPRVNYEKLSDDRLGEPSEMVRSRVEAARQMQRGRFGKGHVHHNADMGVAEVRKFCSLNAEGSALIKSAMSQMQLTARAYHRVIKLARTIADLAGTAQIAPNHLAEALQYRARTAIFQ